MHALSQYQDNTAPGTPVDWRPFHCGKFPQLLQRLHQGHSRESQFRLRFPREEISDTGIGGISGEKLASHFWRRDHAAPQEFEERTRVLVRKL